MTDSSPSTLADVLVVDDSTTNLRLLSHVLRQAGYGVRVARDSSSAVRAASLSPPDLILLDINLPDADGFATFDRIRGIEALEQTPVIFVSGRSDPEDKVRAFESGGADYVTKPFQIPELLARIEHHLQIHRLQEQLREQHDTLRRTEHLREALTGMLVHDMRSPLSSILAALDLLALDDHEPSHRGSLAAARRSTVYLVDLVSALLDVSRPDTSPLEPAAEPFDLGGVVDQVLAPLRDTEPRDRIRFAAPRGCVQAIGDSALTRRIVSNLMENALRAAPDRPVEISIVRRGQAVRVEVADEGPGVAPPHRESIFQMFVHHPLEGPKQPPGRGIGLAFCKLAAEAQRGRIGVTEAPNGGALFWLELPCMASDRAPVES